MMNNKWRVDVFSRYCMYSAICNSSCKSNKDKIIGCPRFIGPKTHILRHGHPATNSAGVRVKNNGPYTDRLFPPGTVMAQFDEGLNAYKLHKRILLTLMSWLDDVMTCEDSTTVVVTEEEDALSTKDDVFSITCSTVFWTVAFPSSMISSAMVTTSLFTSSFFSSTCNNTQSLENAVPYNS